MDKKNITQRHRPSAWSYIQQNFNTTFARAEKAHVMTALLWFFVSATAGTITGLAVPLIWENRFALGLGVFLIIQFLVVTPIRMWRDAVWVAKCGLCRISRTPKGANQTGLPCGPRLTFRGYFPSCSRNDERHPSLMDHDGRPIHLRELTITS
jgi:hypothetical protein